MKLYRNPFGGFAKITQKEDSKTYELLMEQAASSDKFEKCAILDALADLGICPYPEQEGVLKPKLDIDLIKKEINVIIVSNAASFIIGQEEAEKLFLHSMEIAPNEASDCEEKVFLEYYSENLERYNENDEECPVVKVTRTTITDEGNKSNVEESFNPHTNSLKEKKKEPSKEDVFRYYRLGKKRDIITYNDLAEKVYYYSSNYYIKTRYILDDYLDKADKSVANGLEIKR